MPNHDTGCSREALEYWLKARGKTAHQAEGVLRFSDDLITKFLRGRTQQLGIDKLQALAGYLNVPTFALLRPANRADETLRAWGCLLEPDDDRQTMAEYSSLCAQAENHWTIHRSLNAYLLHPDHFQAQEVEMLKSVLDFQRGTETVDAYLERAAKFYGLMRHAHLPALGDEDEKPGNHASPQRDIPARRTHLSSRSFHRIVTQAALFDEVGNAEWAHTAVENLKLFGLQPYGQLLLSLLPPPQFQQLERLVSGILKAARIPGAARWYAINVIDGRYALIQTGDMTYACYHEKVVQELIRQLNIAVSKIDRELGAYFSEDPPPRELMNRVNTRSRRLLETRLREIERRPPS